MRHQGKITKWLDDKGYGFITADNGEKIFVHISAFSRADGRPAIGEVVTYEVAKDIKKGLQAYNVLYPNRPVRVASSNHPRVKKHNNYGFIAVLIVVLITYALWSKFKLAEPGGGSSQVVEAIEKPDPMPAENFQCSGKTRCAEMTSCAEAKFYLKNCPGTVMDSDGDGLPCEDQWCGH